MTRKRKIQLASDENENENENENGQLPSTSKSKFDCHRIMHKIMSKVQLNETFHKKYLKELAQLYSKLAHEVFLNEFIEVIKSAMMAEEANEYANTTLLFSAQFICSFERDDSSSLLADICHWLLSTISYNPHIRFRLCQFVNMILNALGQEATLDDSICNNIMKYMMDRLVDMSASVRVQATLALQRLQVPDNPHDPVLRCYQYHLCSDPSPKVRKAIISCMGRNYQTIPYILDRLWDIDDKVRRHTYLHMSTYPVRSYKVSQRMILLEQGLNDRSEPVRGVVKNVMLKQWIAAYKNDFVAFIGALKLDSDDKEINRFRDIAQQTLQELFTREDKEELISCLILENENEFYRCVPHEKLSLEMSVFWKCLIEYFISESAEELDLIIPELSVFCNYVETFYKTQKTDMDKFEILEFQYVLLSLIEILNMFDLGDEIGRLNLQKLLVDILQNVNINEKTIQVIVRCIENLITDQSTRHQFFLDIIQDMCGLNAKPNDLVHDHSRISELLANSGDADLNFKLSALKVKILELEEQEIIYGQKKDYLRLQQIMEEKNDATEEFNNLLQPLLNTSNTVSSEISQLKFPKVVRNESIIRSLQIAFHMIASKKISSLGHTAYRLYNDFISRHIVSTQIIIRDWALKCGAAFSMLYEPLVKDIFEELYSQFFKNHSIRIWETSITCIFEMMDYYGIDNFVEQNNQVAGEKSGRQLYNTIDLSEAADDDEHSTSPRQRIDVIHMMSHFLGTCNDPCIVRAIIVGFCRLTLTGRLKDPEIVQKLIILYFTPITEPEINQILGVFLNNMLNNKRQHIHLGCFVSAVVAVFSSPYDSPLHDIRSENILNFIINATRSESIENNHKDNAHNKLALELLSTMVKCASNKDLCRLLSREILTLNVKVEHFEELKIEMKTLSDKLIQNNFESMTKKNILNFINMLDGNFNPLKPATSRNESEEEHDNDSNPSDTELNLSNNQLDENEPNNTSGHQDQPNDDKDTHSERVPIETTTTLQEIDISNAMPNATGQINKSINSSDVIIGTPENPNHPIPLRCKRVFRSRPERAKELIECKTMEASDVSGDRVTLRKRRKRLHSNSPKILRNSVNKTSETSLSPLRKQYCINLDVMLPRRSRRTSINTQRNNNLRKRLPSQETINAKAATNTISSISSKRTIDEVNPKQGRSAPKVSSTNRKTPIVSTECTILTRQRLASLNTPINTINTTDQNTSMPISDRKFTDKQSSVANQVVKVKRKIPYIPIVKLNTKPKLTNNRNTGDETPLRRSTRNKKLELKKTNQTNQTNRSGISKANKT